jgi:hypothetical protein
VTEGGVLLEQILKTLELLINQGISIKKGFKKVHTISELSDGSIDYDEQKYERWKESVKIFLSKNIDIERANKFYRMPAKWPSNDWYENICGELAAKTAFLISLKEDIEENPEIWKNFLLDNKTNQNTLSPPDTNSSINIVRKICSRLHTVAKQLRDHRRENRNTIIIEDEYDVQDLLHALLKIFYDDIRPEEWTPSYAGGSSRMDFLIKNEKIVIEVKKTREGLKGKQIADQLFVDIERYKKSHRGCEYLFCFVYDPENLIQNPIGLEKDINEKHKGEAEVLICPKGL